MKSTSVRSIGYVLRELGRRAGAASAWIAQWRFAAGPDGVVLYPDPNRDVRVRFAFDSEKPHRIAELMRARPAVCQPMPGIAQKSADFVVPFETQVSGGPLFAATSAQEVVCRADILTATLWTLSRLEENVTQQRDEHGRFPAHASIAHAFGYLDRPIVDEYGLALQQALGYLCPGWTPQSRRLGVKISHDIDLVGLPRSARTVLGHLYRRRAAGAFVADVRSWAAGGDTAYLRAANELQRTSTAMGFLSAFYWMAATRTTQYDSGYDPRDPLVRSTIERLGEEGGEIGIHPGYDTYASQTRLDEEVARLREVVGDGEIGGRQHYLRWDPSTWLQWERAGLSYDSTVGFADGIGFRAGTATPYHPWLIDEDRETPLLEVPLVVMDCAPVAYMRLAPRDTLARIRTLVARCEAAGGVFTLLWHNTSVIERPYARLYPEILKMLAHGRSYDWRQDRAIAPLPRLVEPAAAP